MENNELEAQVAALREELEGYKQGAKVEADAGDEARREAHGLQQRLADAERRNATFAELLAEVVEKQNYELEHRGARYRARWEKTLQKLKSTTEKLSGADSHE